MKFPIPSISRRSFLGRLAPVAAAPLLGAGCGAGRTVVPGIEVLLNRKMTLIRGRNVGLITNHTGVDRRLRHDIDLLQARPEVELAALFSPEHGIAGTAAAGARIASRPNSLWGIPVHSLYGATTQPTEEMVRGLDLLIYDMQDVGSRYYTYLATLRNCLQAADRFRIPLIVLDRPNPLGGLSIEGRVLDARLQSLGGARAHTGSIRSDPGRAGRLDEVPPAPEMFPDRGQNGPLGAPALVRRYRPGLGTPVAPIFPTPGRPWSMPACASWRAPTCRRAEAPPHPLKSPEPPGWTDRGPLRP